MGIVVENPGLLTTVQDEGRFGYQQFGVSPAGPMDTRSFYPVSYTHLRAHETELHLVCRLLLEKIFF